MSTRQLLLRVIGVSQTPWGRDVLSWLRGNMGHDDIGFELVDVSHRKLDEKVRASQCVLLELDSAGNGDEGLHVAEVQVLQYGLPHILLVKNWGTLALPHVLVSKSERELVICANEPKQTNEAEREAKWRLHTGPAAYILGDHERDPKVLAFVRSVVVEAACTQLRVELHRVAMEFRPPELSRK